MTGGVGQGERRVGELEVIGAGFGRTGTLSLRAALVELGYGPVCHGVDIAFRPTHVLGWRKYHRTGQADWRKMYKRFRSAIDYPVFVNGENYAGRSPQLVRHPVLRSLVRACLGARIAMAPDALVIPLGKAAEKAVSLLTADGLVSPGRCLTGFPHPSPQNGHRVSQYAANQAALIVQVAQWALRRPSIP